MAATPPDPQKRKLDFNVSRATYDDFMKVCSRKGYAPQVLIEQMMKKYIQTGQI